MQREVGSTSVLESTPAGPSVVAYHYPCPDGIFAALAAHLHFQRHETEGIRYHPNRVFQPCTTQELKLQDKETLYLLDYVGPVGFAADAARQAGRVVILDHHKTAAEALQDRSNLPKNLDVTLDMERSGATIALDHFQPEITDMQRQLFHYIEDADLWRWALPDSRMFSAGFGSLNLEFDVNKNPGIFEQLLSLDTEAVKAKGREVEDEQAQQIAAALKTAFVVNLGGSSGREKGWGRCLCVRSEPLAHLRSRLGNELAEKAKGAGLRAIGLVAYVEEAMNDPSRIKCSLRSVGDEDTTVISTAYAGGGHKNASSFIISINEFETWKR